MYIITMSVNVVCLSITLMVSRSVISEHHRGFVVRLNTQDVWLPHIFRVIRGDAVCSAICADFIYHGRGQLRVHWNVGGFVEGRTRNSLSLLSCIYITPVFILHSHGLTGGSGEPNPWILSVTITWTRAGYAQTRIPVAEVWNRRWKKKKRKSASKADNFTPVDMWISNWYFHEDERVDVLYEIISTRASWNFCNMQIEMDNTLRPSYCHFCLTIVAGFSSSE